MLYRICRFLSMTFFYRPLYWQKIYGKEHLLKKGQKCVLLCNHYKVIDLFFISTLQYEKIYFMGKKEAFKNKLGSFFLNSFGAIPVDRGEADLQAVKKCMRVLKENKKLCIFPEGTRNKKEDYQTMLELKGGAGLIALKCDSPIIPIVMEKPFKIFHKNRAYVGEPFTLEEFKGVKITSEVSEQINQLIKTKFDEARNELNKIIDGGKK